MYRSINLDVVKFSFSHSVINEWNILSEEIIAGNSLSGFKRKNDRHFRDIRGYIIGSVHTAGTRHIIPVTARREPDVLSRKH